MGNAPQVTNVYYDGSFVKMNWTASDDTGVTGYRAKILYGASNALFYSQDINGRLSAFASLPLDGGALDSNVDYMAQVVALHGGQEGQDEASQLVPLITRLPQLNRIYYDGTDFCFEWTPTSQAVQGYILNLGVEGGQIYTSSTAYTSSGITKGKILKSDLNGMDPYRVGARMTACVSAVGNNGANDGSGSVYGSSAGISLPNPLLPASLGSGFAYWEGIGLNVTWTPLAEVDRYLFNVLAPDGSVISSAAFGNETDPQELIPLAPDTLSPFLAYSLQLLALNDAGGGSATAPAPFISGFARIEEINFNDARNVQVKWSFPWKSDGVRGYVAGLFNLSTLEFVGNTVTVAANVFSASIPAASLSTATNYGVFVAASNLPPSELGAWSPSAGAQFRFPMAPAAGNALQVLSMPLASPFPVEGRVIVKAISDGSALSVEWSPMAAGCATAPDGYLLSLFDGASVVSSVSVKGRATTSSTLLFPDPAKSYSVGVQAVKGVGAGPASSPYPVIVAAPRITRVSTDPVSNIATIYWSTVGNAIAYQLTFDSGAAPISLAGSGAAALPNPLPKNSKVAVRLAGTGANEVVGPASASFALPTGQPVASRAGYDGINARVSWLPVDGASGYVATVLGTKGTATVAVADAKVEATACSAEVPLSSPDSATTYTVVVQALFNGINAQDAASCSGPPGNGLPLFQAGFFVSSTVATTCTPFVYPATCLGTVQQEDPGKTGEAITCYLPEIGTTPPLQGLPKTVGPFTLAQNGDAPTNSAYPYMLQIPASATAGDPTSPWTFSAAPIRADLQTNYVNFLVEVEKLGISPWGIMLLQQIIGRILPQSFAELLYYNYGFNYSGAGNGSVDLRPGMVLRLAINPYQMVAGESATSWLSGYVGGPVVDYDIGSQQNSNGSWQVGFDAFIWQLVASGALKVSPPSTQGAGQATLEAGIAEASDLYFPAFPNSFYRLFVPTQLLTSTGTGSKKDIDNFVLASATSFQSLGASSNIPSSTNPAVLFRGRTVVKLCIRVTVNGRESVVPIGTTLANLLERQGVLPPVVARPLQGITLERSLGGVVSDPKASLPVFPGWPLRLDWRNAPVYGPNWGVFSMPLLPGDRLTVQR